MTITINQFTTSRLLAQPYSYDATETKDGLTARAWRFNGLLTATEWQQLLLTYDNWRNLRITDPDSVASNSIGTTVTVSSAANGLAINNAQCWFLDSPSGEQRGSYIDASCALVDAEQALQVALRKKEKDKKAEDLPDLGTFTIGACTITLRRPPETYQDIPSLLPTAGGNHYVQGPLTATKVMNIEGETDALGWTALQSWFETTVTQRPTPGSYFPTSAPIADAKSDVVNGLKVTTYTVSISLGVVK